MNFRKISVIALGLGAMLMTACGPKGLTYEQACEHVQKNFTHSSEEEKEVSKYTEEWDFSATTGEVYKALAKSFIKANFGGHEELKGSWVPPYKLTVGYLNIDGFKLIYPNKEAADKAEAKFSADGKKLIIAVPMKEDYAGFEWKYTATSKTTDDGLPIETKNEFKDLHFDAIGEGKITGYTKDIYEY